MDGSIGGNGISALSSSGAVTTTNANDLIVGANLVAGTTTGPGTSFTSRLITNPDGDILEDRVVSAVGSYSATAALTGGSWVMQMVAFRAGAGGADTQPPTAPSGLGATAISATQITLTWTASTDNVGVTGYLIERCQGAGCTTFAQIAAPGTGTTYSDTGLTATTSYSYRVRATDAAGNLSLYSTVASATTQTVDTQPPTAPSGLGATAASASQIILTWTASTDNVGVTGYLIERCQGAGCTTFAQIAAPGTGTMYSDTGLTASTSYSYRVRATDAAGNLSLYSNTASATTLTAVAISFVQANAAVPQTAMTVVTIPYAGAQTAGDLNVVVVGWNDTTAQVQSVADTKGNPYTLAVGPTVAPGLGTQAIYYAKNVQAAAANANVVTVTFSQAAQYADIRIAEYSGIDPANAVDGSIGGNGTGALSSSGAVTTTNANDLIVGANLVAGTTTGPGTSFTSRLITIPDGDILEDRVVSAVGSYSATAALTGGDWVMQMVAFRAGAGGPDTQPPTAPSGLGATAISATQITLTWTASTDNVGVTGYLIERCQGAGCTTFAQIAAPGTGTTYSDTGLTATTSYSYRVRATDAAGNLSPYSNTASATTQTVDTQPPTAPSGLGATAASASQINLTWTASTDNVGVTGYLIERCQGAGCTTFAQIAAPGTGTTYSDTGLTASTSYSYRVRATDAAGNLSPYSNTASSTTPSAGGGFTVSPRAAVLTLTQTQPFTATGGTPPIVWSVDGTVGGSSTAGTITAGGVYAPPSSPGTHTVTATSSTQAQASATVYISNYPGTFTIHNDNLRTGQNLNETALTPATVSSATFGKLFTYPLDGLTHGSALYVASVSIPGKGFHNVVYVATEHDTVYAFDADGLSASPLWQVSFINPAAGVTTVPAADTGEGGDIAPEIGITSTPVIDQGSGTLYVVAKTKEVVGGTTSYVQRLHALDLTTGAEKFGGPVALQATVPGTGDGASGGQLPFSALHENQRPGLLLSNGVVYMAFASHGDNDPWHGWVLGYNATTLQQTVVFNATANGYGGGVWHSGGGLAADPAGNVYFVTSNGPFDVNTGGVDYGDSFMKLSASGAVVDYFTPHDQGNLATNNLDLGSGGVLLLPDQSGAHPHLMLSAGKDGTIYLVDRDNMGHYNANNDSQIVQSLVNIFPFGTVEPGNNSSPVYFNGNVYFSPISDNIQAFQVTNGLLSTQPPSRSSENYFYPGAALAVSANVNVNGILWALQRQANDTTDEDVTGPAILRAYDASNLGTELYNSTQAAGSRDALNDPAVKFSIPLVANGKTFVVTRTLLTVYGLLP